MDLGLSIIFGLTTTSMYHNFIQHNCIIALYTLLTLFTLNN
jgi:hypothetical protein